MVSPQSLDEQRNESNKITGRHNGKKLVRFKAIPWTYQRDELKSKMLGMMVNGFGSSIESIAWRVGDPCLSVKATSMPSD